MRDPFVRRKAARPILDNEIPQGQSDLNDNEREKDNRHCANPLEPCKASEHNGVKDRAQGVDPKLQYGGALRRQFGVPLVVVEDVKCSERALNEKKP